MNWFCIIQDKSEQQSSLGFFPYFSRLIFCELKSIKRFPPLHPIESLLLPIYEVSSVVQSFKKSMQILSKTYFQNQ